MRLQNIISLLNDVESSSHLLCDERLVAPVKFFPMEENFYLQAERHLPARKEIVEVFDCSCNLFEFFFVEVIQLYREGSIRAGERNLSGKSVSELHFENVESDRPQMGKKETNLMSVIFYTEEEFRFWFIMKKAARAVFSINTHIILTYFF